MPGMLPPSAPTSFLSRHSRLRPVGLKSASGGHRRYTAPKLFEMPSGTKDFSLFETKVRQDAASAQTGVREYDLSGLSGADLTKATERIRSENPGSPEVKREPGHDADTFTGSIEVKVPGGVTHPGASEGSPGTVTTGAPQASLSSQFIVYWISPTTPSTRNDGTLRDHENSHVQAHNAVLGEFNSRATPLTIPVPGGRGSFQNRAQGQVDSTVPGKILQFANQLKAEMARRDAVIDGY